MKTKLILPHEGQGLHDEILRQSRHLLIEGYDVNQVTEILVNAAEQSCRTTQDLIAEIENAVLGANEFLTENPGFRAKEKTNDGWKPWIDPLSFLSQRDGMCRGDKRDIRSTKLDQNLRREALASKKVELINGGFSFFSLFAGINFKICAGLDKYSGPVKRLNDWNIRDEFPKMQFIVPNYFWNTSEEGGDKSDYNAGRRLFLVVEFDDESLANQLAVLSFLHCLDFRLFMIVYSGHRSLHGWFTCYGRSEYKVVSFCIRAKKLGADKMCYSPSQYVRMPNGFNSKYKKKQDVIFFDQSRLDWQTSIVRSDLL
jgi:hypothetical protein